MQRIIQNTNPSNIKVSLCIDKEKKFLFMYSLYIYVHDVGSHIHVRMSEINNVCLSLSFTILFLNSIILVGGVGGGDRQTQTVLVCNAYGGQKNGKISWSLSYRRL